MLTNSFIHVPGIGARRERDLWASGIKCWDDCLCGNVLDGASPSLTNRLRATIRASTQALQQSDGVYFATRMPPHDSWRLYPEFKNRTVFLDIETTGLSPHFDDITVISLFDGKRPRALIKGRDLKEFPRIIGKYSLIVTYNGATFDLPFLHRKFKRFNRNYAHIDLRYPLARLGLTGGLKGVERKAGIRREGMLSAVDGFMAVRLWREHQQGNPTALNTLLRYALEDVVNLPSLMVLAYNRHIKAFPLRVPRLKQTVPPRIKIPFDAKLIKRLAEYSSWW